MAECAAAAAAMAAAASAELSNDANSCELWKPRQLIKTNRISWPNACSVASCASG
jgi:hypothetical protein